MPNLWLDTETFCETPIKWGTYRYAEKAEVMLLQWAIDDGPVSVWDATFGNPLPEAVWDALLDPSVLIWFQNGDKFDWPVLACALPEIAQAVPIERRRDTMVQAYCHGLPGNLEMMCAALGVEDDKAKSKEGKRLIRLFCMPQKSAPLLRGITLLDDGSWRATRTSHPAEWEEFKAYAGQDIIAMRECHRRMPTWNYKGKQLDLWFLDQRMNARGMQMDVELAEAAVRASSIAKKQLAVQTRELTHEGVQSATQRDNMLAWILEAYGVDLPDMTAATLERRIKDDDLPEELRELLRVRLQSTTTSVAKYTTLLNGVNSDGRLRGCMQYRGAMRTGRVAHRMFQPGNMPRPDMPTDEIMWAIELLKLDAAHLVFDNVMRVCSNTIRSTIIAPPGKKLVIADLANIEGRVAAWLAGEAWKLTAFRAADAGTGPDLYVRAYASAFNVDPETVGKGPKRQIGKVCLAKGSLVLTSSGWKAIETVSIADHLWDGVQWVAHRGLLSQGTRLVVDLASLFITPDHSVLCGTQWKDASLLLGESTFLSRALASGAARLPSRAILSAFSVAFAQRSCVAIAGALSMAFSQVISAAVKVLAVVTVLAPQPTTRNVGGSTPTPCPRPSIAGGYSRALLQPVSDARRLTMQVGPTTVAEAFESVICGSGIAQHFLRTFARCRGGMTRVLRWTARTLTGTTSPATFSSSRKGKTFSIVARFLSFRPKSSGCVKRMPTFDLACAGPRKRFTVLTAKGPLIVHNCELMFQYQGGVGAWITGAATYGIDLAQMTEQVWDTLPTWAKDEAEQFLQWLYEDALNAYARAVKRVNEKVELLVYSAEDAMVELDAAAIQRDARCKKKRFGLTEKTFIACDAIKRLWRKANPQISSYWKEIEVAIEIALGEKGKQLQCRMLKIRCDGAWLRVGLPSGRVLCYPQPMWDAQVKRADGTVKSYPGFSYMGISAYTKKWQRIGSYGGKVFENVVQAAACDVLLETGEPIEAAGFEPVMSVHDEWICEAPGDRDDLSDEFLSGLMCAENTWNAGLPLAAAGFETQRYHKEQ